MYRLDHRKDASLPTATTFAKAFRRNFSKAAPAVLTFLVLVASGTWPKLAVMAAARQTSGNLSQKEFAKAKKELSSDNYLLYRIVEKISRSNGLANYSWRVRIRDQYALNGFADETNLIVVPKPAMDQLAGDIDAVACLVSREISHHVRKHQAIGPAEQEAMKQKFQKEAEEEATNTRIGGTIFGGVVNGLLGGLGVSPINTSSITESLVASIYKKKTEELRRKIAETSSRIDKEADEDAFIYLVRADRDPKGCIRYLDVISRDPKAEPDPANPQIPGRLQSYREFMESETPAKFKKEGKANLARNVKPLTYAITDNGATIRINSSRGENTANVDKF
jgi:hypothetical protein